MGLNLTPKEIVSRLDQYIIGQDKAKRSVAVALRNRYRRMQLKDDLKDEIVPKNILMIGPTGVGKTEIARRLANLVRAPFVKVEATKFTEVGYVGRDVESMVRDLVEMSLRMVKEERMEKVKNKAEKEAEKQLVKLLVPNKQQKDKVQNPFELFFQTNQSQNNDSQAKNDSVEEDIKNERKRIAHQLALGELEDHLVTINVTEEQPSFFDLLQGSGMDQQGMNMQDALSTLMPKRKRKRRLTVREARKVLTDEEARKLVDIDEAKEEAIYRAEQSGIIFIDEMDKIASTNQHDANVSREGVQRDILPIVEGSTIMTKYGSVKTDHILFIAAGAFHMSKPSDLIPELQGRFPIRVELEKLSVDDFKRILEEPSNALLKQYHALLKTENINVQFTDEAIVRLAEIAYEVNQETDNIGARRLHTILEKLLEDLSFEAPDVSIKDVQITKEYVDEKLMDVVKNRDLSRFIL